MFKTKKRGQPPSPLLEYRQHTPEEARKHDSS